MVLPMVCKGPFGWRARRLRTRVCTQPVSVRAARPSERARCGAGAGCSTLKYQSLSIHTRPEQARSMAMPRAFLGR
jgi:hypothetical protein